MQADGTEPLGSEGEATEISFSYQAARLLWAKTWQREYRRLDSRDTKLEIAELVHRTSRPDRDDLLFWTIPVDLDQPLEAASLIAFIRERPQQSLDVFTWVIDHLGTQPQKASFQACRRKLGRDPRIKALVLDVEKILKRHGFDLRVHDLPCAPFPRPFYQRAKEVRDLIAAGLIEWVTPCVGEVEVMLRRYVAENNPREVDPEKREAALSYVQRRTTPNLCKIFPKNIRLEIFNALGNLREHNLLKSQGDYQRPEAGEAGQREEREVLRDAGQHVSAILEKAKPILDQQGIDLDSILTDIIDYDSWLTRDQILADEEPL